MKKKQSKLSLGDFHWGMCDPDIDALAILRGAVNDSIASHRTAFELNGMQERALDRIAERLNMFIEEVDRLRGDDR